MRSFSNSKRVELPAATVVIVQNNPTTARALSDDLYAHFANVMVAESASELHSLLLRNPKVQMAVLDLELVNMEEVRWLAGACGDLAIVCTHPSPDDRMWIAALNAGAVEYCHPDDIRSIVRARYQA
jgi:DNA-binding response OmpR family regulator